MAGIVGIESDGKQEQVNLMLNKLVHRGDAGSKVIESHGTTLGAFWPETQAVPNSVILQQQAVWDGSQAPLPEPAALRRKPEPFALIAAGLNGLFVARDLMGVRPLYYGQMDDETLCFASEVKALLEVTQDIHEFPPGTWYDSEQGFQVFSEIERRPALRQETDEIAAGLRLRLEQSVCQRVDNEVMGCWLSGGLDSSVMAALARPHVQKLHTFGGGIPGAPDLEYARQVADFLDTEHHEILVTLEELLTVLPEVIYYLESFDALLVRSSITNYLVAKHTADYAGSLFSGEGADELFGGYAYLKDLSHNQLSDELVDITQRLHNTALQRVDRSASAHGLVAHVPFLDLDVANYAMSIPPQLKLRRDNAVIEKWILRRAMSDVLPDDVLWRRKAKFWQGAGVDEMLAQYAAEHISDNEFEHERYLVNGWALNTKEELLYYRIFREHFGELGDLSWMGRTKGAPVN